MKYQRLFRYLIIISTVLFTIFITTKTQYPQFTFLVLLFVLNVELRSYIKHKNLVLVSLFLDCALVLYMCINFTVYNALFLLVTLEYVLLKLNDEMYHLFIITTLVYLYTLRHSPSYEIGILMIFIYVMISLLIVYLRKELLIKANVENLYDEIRRNHYELDRARNRLKEYSKQVEKVTVLEERNRISRELHDSLGHHLTGVLLQLDSGIQMMDVNKDKGMEIIKSAYQNVNDGIESVRNIVRKVRPVEYQSHQKSVKDLIDEFVRKTETFVQYKVSGNPYELYPSIETVIYRNIQEALTNAVRHGKATHILVHMIYKQNGVEVLIEDNGVGCKELNKGMGLTGIEERLDIIDGRIHYKTDGGFGLHMVIPRREMT